MFRIQEASVLILEYYSDTLVNNKSGKATCHEFFSCNNLIKGAILSWKSQSTRFPRKNSKILDNVILTTHCHTWQKPTK